MASPKKISPEEWEIRRPAIHELFISKKPKLGEVIDEMESEGFYASQQQYKRQFKKWNMTKNLTDKEWKYIHAVISRRSLLNKRSVVFVHGEEISPRKQLKETTRHSSLLLAQQEPYLETTDHIRVCTPDGLGTSSVPGHGSDASRVGKPANQLNVAKYSAPDMEVMLKDLPSLEMIDLLDRNCKLMPVQRCQNISTNSLGTASGSR